MVRVRLLNIAMTLAIGFTPLFASAGGSIARGWGVVKCSNIITYGPGKGFFGTTYAIQSEAISWSMGYLSGLALAEGGMDAPSAHAYNKGFGGVSTGQLESAIVQMCKDKPLSSLSDISNSIYRQLGGRLFIFE